MEMLCRRYRAARDEDRVPRAPDRRDLRLRLALRPPVPRRQRPGFTACDLTAAAIAGLSRGSYISLERLIEESQEEYYYRILKVGSQGWHDGESEILAWWNYFLGLVRSAYKEFERPVESVQARPAKTDLVRHTVLSQVADMAAKLPVASPQLIKKVLGEMKQARRVRLAGRGRGARWEVVRAR